MGKLVGIARATSVRNSMEVLNGVAITEEKGVDQDRRGAVKGAQVTVLAREDWEAALLEIGAELPWTARRANLLVEGVRLPQEIGAMFQVGDVVLVVREETKPCSMMEKAKAGLRAALTPDWRGGVRCDVAQGGYVQVGDVAGPAQPRKQSGGKNGI